MSLHTAHSEKILEPEAGAGPAYYISCCGARSGGTALFGSISADIHADMASSSSRPPGNGVNLSANITLFGRA